jgi:hypothetical protein
MVVRALLILPCNKCIKRGDYSLCRNWRIVLRYVRPFIEAGTLYLAAVEGCKPGILLWGEERAYTHCDTYPSWDRVYARDPARLERLIAGVARDLKELSTRYDVIAHYVNVKAYKLALQKAGEITGVKLVDFGPPKLSPLSYSKHAKELPKRLEQLTPKPSVGLSRWL